MDGFRYFWITDSCPLVRARACVRAQARAGVARSAAHAPSNTPVTPPQPSCVADCELCDRPQAFRGAEPGRTDRCGAPNLGQASRRHERLHRPGAASSPSTPNTPNCTGPAPGGPAPPSPLCTPPCVPTRAPPWRACPPPVPPLAASAPNLHTHPPFRPHCNQAHWCASSWLGGTAPPHCRPRAAANPPAHCCAALPTSAASAALLPQVFAFAPPSAPTQHSQCVQQRLPREGTLDRVGGNTCARLLACAHLHLHRGRTAVVAGALRGQGPRQACQ